MSEQNSYIIVKQSYPNKEIEAVFKTKQEAVDNLKQIAKKLNCPQKIIWLNQLAFNLSSSNGVTQKYCVVEKE